MKKSQSQDKLPTKKEILRSIKKGLCIVKLREEGKIKLKSARQLLEEL